LKSSSPHGRILLPGQTLLDHVRVAFKVATCCWKLGSPIGPPAAECDDGMTGEKNPVT
jgi:hypothetical protein